jgi:hypothetical protein
MHAELSSQLVDRHAGPVGLDQVVGLIGVQAVMLLERSDGSTGRPIMSLTSED